MTEYIQAAVNVPQVSGVFDYQLPPELEDKIQPGCLVAVPFGKQLVQGVVLRRVDEPQVMEPRLVTAVLDSTPALTSAQLDLAQELSEKYLAPLSAFIDLMLPPGLSQHADKLYSRNPGVDAPAVTPTQKRILAEIEKRGSLRGRQLDAAIPRIEWRPSAAALVKAGVLITQPVLPPPSVRPKVVRTAQLSRPLEQARQILDDAPRMGSAVRSRRISALEFLAREAVPVSVSWVYAGSGTKLADLEKLAELGLVQLGGTEIWRDPLRDLVAPVFDPPVLTHAQEEALEKIDRGLVSASRGGTPKPALLHGVTGSGKTEIYLKAIERTLVKGKQAIVLVPEIALTPQTVRRLLARFPGRVGLIHSRLSPGERYDTWRRARDGALDVILGPRSALFTPLPNLGLIVVDECHEGSYYQDDLPPFYHAVDAALALARLTKSVIILGSATPSVEMVQQANLEVWERLELPNRLLAHRAVITEELQAMKKEPPALAHDQDAITLPMPPVSIIDMRTELKEGNRSVLSRALQVELGAVLERGEQVILFLNRRGSATYVFCRECGAPLRCPRCERPLTWHEDTARLTCHSCGYTRQMPQICPVCNSREIRQYGTGTQAVEKLVQEVFPAARTLRWDWETTRAKGANDMILSHFANHRADILIGTQLLAKGLDLPLVTLVGVILADVGLNFPDFRAAERTFQLLTQVAGRAGRSPLGGRVIFQTFQPENYAIQSAALHDFNGFFHQELGFRRDLGYPPFTNLVKVEFREMDAGKAEKNARNFAAQARVWMVEGGYKATELIGPVPCFFSKEGGYFRWQVILKGPNPAGILRGRPLGDARVVVDPPSLL
jgi:primosomal protein N' (replication factor Y) (superfamily II helicase)